jgi:hypothetical protein
MDSDTKTIDKKIVHETAEHRRVPAMGKKGPAATGIAMALPSGAHRRRRGRRRRGGGQLHPGRGDARHKSNRFPGDCQLSTKKNSDPSETLDVSLYT